MAKESEEFLKDQVQRLTAALSQYQKKYLPLSPAETESLSLSPHAPWLTNKQFLSPLLVEYDHTISELNGRVSSYQTELTSLTGRVAEVVEENTKLHSDLRKSLENQLRSSSAGGGDGGGVTEALQEQLDILSRERDNYVDLWRGVTKQLEAVQRDNRENTENLQRCKSELVRTQQATLLAQQTIDKLNTTCEKLDQERGQCLSRVHAQERELNSLQEEAAQTRAEAKAASIKNNDLKRSLDEITLQLHRRESERKKVEDHEQSLDNRVHHLQLHTADLEAKLLVSQREAALLKGEKSDLQEALNSVQAKLSMLEQRETEAVLHVKESMQIAEDALLEKDQALLREQQCAAENGRLKKTLDTILQEAGERTRSEVDTVRAEYNANIDKMAEEIHKLEQECGQRQAQYDKTLRDKKALGKELEKLTKHGPQETAQRGEVLHELQAKVCTAERAKEEVSLRLDATLTSLKSLEVRLAEEKRAKDELGQNYNATLKKHQEEVQQFQQQKMRLMAEIKEHQQRVRQSQQLQETAQLCLVRERTEWTRKHEQTQRELLNRLKSSEEAYQKSVYELREVMAAHHRVGVKSREESKVLAQRCEETVSSLKAEISKHKQYEEELTVQLQHLKLERKEFLSQLQKLSAANSVLQQQLAEAEMQVESTTSQLSALASRERGLLEEKRQLHRQLDKVKVKVSRIGSMEGPRITNDSAYQVAHSRSRTPSLPRHYRPVTSLPPAQLDSSQWNTALSELRHSIRQVRQDLGMSLQQQDESGYPNVEDDDVHSSYSRDDEHSTLSRTLSLVQS